MRRVVVIHAAFNSLRGDLYNTKECQKLINNLDAVDAKIARARLQLRRLKTDIADLCSELADLIVAEEREGRHHWVYRGGEPRAPLEWSVRAGEYAHNLRSALDHVVWQLSAAHGQCAGRHGAGSECPGRHTRFPMDKPTTGRRFEKQLCGVGDDARDYIRSVQPYRESDNDSRSELRQTSRGLAMLGDICNRDKHRLPLTAVVRWTGDWPSSARWTSFQSSGPEDPYCPDRRVARGAVVRGHELRHGETLLITRKADYERCLTFPLDAYFHRSHCGEDDQSESDTASEILEACLRSVDMVISRLRREV